MDRLEALAGPAAVLGVAVLALLLALRFTKLAAEIAILVTRLVRGPERFYGEGRAAGGMVARFGRARTELAPRGKVFVSGELWHAVAERPVPAGARVEVLEREGLVLRVRRAESAERPRRPDRRGHRGH